MGQAFRNFLDGWLSVELQRALAFPPILIYLIRSGAVGAWPKPLFGISGELPSLGGLVRAALRPS